LKHSVPGSHPKAAPELTSDLSSLMQIMKNDKQPYVLATVVRTMSVTAAKAGAKAIIAEDGSVAAGWIGGGCARAAVIKAAKAAFEDGETRLISIRPEELLQELGITPGDEREGVQFAKNMCPSQGTMDIFIEPVLPHPALIIYGASPVAQALAAQAPTIGFDITVCAQSDDLGLFETSVRLIDGFVDVPAGNAETFVVVSTQGRGDLAALASALKTPVRHVGFVGSRRKLAALRVKLLEQGLTEEEVARIKGPAGLDLGAITPEEIALSILAELLMIRRKNQRQTNIHHV